MQLKGLLVEAATWEDYEKMMEKFLNFTFEDKGILEVVGMLRTLPKGAHCSRIGPVLWPKSVNHKPGGELHQDEADLKKSVDRFH